MAIPLDLTKRVMAAVRQWHATNGAKSHPVIRMASATRAVLDAEVGKPQTKITTDDTIPVGQFTLSES